jgi:hypothetical protein
MQHKQSKADNKVRKTTIPTPERAESVRHNDRQQMIERVLERRHDMLVKLR